MALILTFYPLLTSGLILQFNKDLCELLFGKVVFFHKLYTRLHDFRRVLVAFTNTAECVVNASASLLRRTFRSSKRLSCLLVSTSFGFRRFIQDLLFLLKIKNLSIKLAICQELRKINKFDKLITKSRQFKRRTILCKL